TPDASERVALSGAEGALGVRFVVSAARATVVYLHAASCPRPTRAVVLYPASASDANRCARRYGERGACSSCQSFPIRFSRGSTRCQQVIHTLSAECRIGSCTAMPDGIGSSRRIPSRRRFVKRPVGLGALK